MLILKQLRSVDMLFAIKYETNKKGAKIANRTLKKYDSAVMFRSENTGVFFTNPIVALKVSRHLNEVNKALTYKVYKLSKEDANKIDNTLIVSTYEEYKALIDKQYKETLRKLKELEQRNDNLTME